MNSTTSRSKKSPSSKARRKPERGCVRRTSRSISPRGGASVPASRRRNQTKRLVSSLAPLAAAGRSDTAALLREFRAWRASLPTALERDTMLMPDVIAETVVQEVEQFLGEELPARYAVWLAAKAELCYSARRQFYRTLRRSGNASREWLGVYMRHWLDSLLGLERPDLHHCLPREFGNGRQLPHGLHPRINRRGFIRDLLPNSRGWDAARVTRHFRWAWLLRVAA